jgi:radical SAM protein with 4Fe4S-binding SPASM domain
MIRGFLMIKFMDIQLYTECNRTCWFCPAHNKFKPKETNFISEEVIKKIVTDIKLGIKNKNIKEDLKICLTKYFEPLLHFDFFINKAIYIKQNIKTCHLHTQTNGDKLNKGNAFLLINIFDSIKINFYDLNFLETLDKLKEIFNEFEIIKINKETNEIQIRKNEKTINIVWEKEKVFKEGKKLLKTRGGILDLKVEKRKNCFIKNDMVTIDANGDIYPCCELVGYIEQHKKIVLGNVLQDNIVDVNAKYKTLDTNNKNCLYCNAGYKNIFGSDYDEVN